MPPEGPIVRNSARVVEIVVCRGDGRFRGGRTLSLYLYNYPVEARCDGDSGGFRGIGATCSNVGLRLVCRSDGDQTVTFSGIFLLSVVGLGWLMPTR